MQGSDQLWLREPAKVEDFVEGETAGLGRRSKAGGPAGRGNPGNLGGRKGSGKGWQQCSQLLPTPAPPERDMCPRDEGCIAQYLLLGIFLFGGSGDGCVSAGAWWIVQNILAPL